MAEPARVRPGPGPATRDSVAWKLLFAFTLAAVASCSSPPVVDDPLPTGETWLVTRYAVVVDAGSSGSRVRIFKADVEVSARPTPPDVPVTRCVGCPSESPPYRPAGDLDGTSWNLKVEPGLSSFANDPASAAQSLVPLIEYAKSKVPKDAWPQTPIHVLATAGLRLISDTQKGAIVRAVADELGRHGAIRGQVAVISGDDEAGFAWGTVNALLGPEAPSTGVLDLGGGSTQIAFEDPSTKTLVKKSWLGWGQDEGFRRVWSPACLPRGYVTKDESHADPLTGTGDFAECKRAIEALAESDPSAPSAQAPPTMPFVAVSGYFYTADFFGIAGTLNLKSLKDKASAFCAEDFETSKAQHPDVPVKYLGKYCFAAAHISVLTGLLGFPTDTRDIRAVGDIEGMDPGWPLGALLSVGGAVR